MQCDGWRGPVSDCQQNLRHASSGTQGALAIRWREGESHDRTHRTAVASSGTPRLDPTARLNLCTHETFVLLPVDEYNRLKQKEYDDSPWTREELQALAWERIKDEDWNEYDDLPDQTMRRGDVVLVRFPHPSGQRGKKRPAVVVQSDAYASTVTTVVVAEVTKNLKSEKRPRLRVHRRQYSQKARRPGYSSIRLSPAWCWTPFTRIRLPKCWEACPQR